MASNAGTETGYERTATAEAVDENAPRTAAWLDFDTDIQQLTVSGTTPPWMEVGGSSGERTPTEDNLLGTGWM